MQSMSLWMGRGVIIHRIGGSQRRTRRLGCPHANEMPSSLLPEWNECDVTELV